MGTCVYGPCLGLHEHEDKKKSRNRTLHWEPLRPRSAGSGTPPSNLATARSVVARLDPALLGRPGQLLASAAIASRRSFHWGQTG